MVSGDEIVALHERLTRAWHEVVEVGDADAGDVDATDDWMALVARQHRANFDLWHIEDEARAPGCSDEELAAVKRSVDSTNQRRNDLAEQLDRTLIDWLAAVPGQGFSAARKLQEHPSGAKARADWEQAHVRAEARTLQHSEARALGTLPNPEAPLNSESPGLMIDRLSILGLKIYHTREEAERADAPQGHGERNRERLAILEEQRADLAHCLDRLWTETLAGTRRFKLYRQLKMYNDPSLNPAVYRKLVKEQSR